MSMFGNGSSRAGYFSLYRAILAFCVCVCVCIYVCLCLRISPFAHPHPRPPSRRATPTPPSDLPQPSTNKHIPATRPASLGLRNRCSEAPKHDQAQHHGPCGVPQTPIQHHSPSHPSSTKPNQTKPPCHATPSLPKRRRPKRPRPKFRLFRAASVAAPSPQRFSTHTRGDRKRAGRALCWECLCGRVCLCDCVWFVCMLGHAVRPRGGGGY